jgi:hypothetical protein
VEENYCDVKYYSKLLLEGVRRTTKIRQNRSKVPLRFETVASCRSVTILDEESRRKGISYMK